MAQINKNRGPYSLDVNTVSHRKTKITTILNTPVFDNMVENLDTAYEYTVGYVPNGYEHRPDLISNTFYGTPKYWWLLLLVNGISDPFEGFLHNQRILIPKI